MISSSIFSMSNTIGTILNNEVVNLKTEKKKLDNFDYLTILLMRIYSEYKR